MLQSLLHVSTKCFLTFVINILFSKIFAFLLKKQNKTKIKQKQKQNKNKQTKKQKTK